MTRVMGMQGRFLRHRRLGTDAVYRVTEEHEELVVVEVLWAPGLLPGTTLRFDRAFAEQLDVCREQEVRRGQRRFEPGP